MTSQACIGASCSIAPAAVQRTPKCKELTVHHSPHDAAKHLGERGQLEAEHLRTATHAVKSTAGGHHYSGDRCCGEAAMKHAGQTGCGMLSSV